MTESNQNRGQLPLPGILRPGARRFELRIEGILYHLHELGGRRVLATRMRKVAFRPDYLIRRGEDGPELVFKLNQPPFAGNTELQEANDRIYDAIMPGNVCAAPDSPADGRERPALLDRLGGLLGNGPRARLIWRRTRVALGVLVCVLTLFVSNSYWGGGNPELNQTGAELRVPLVETRRASSGEDYMQIGRLIDRLIYRPFRPGDAGVREGSEAALRQKIILLMKEFGAEEYTVPSDFITEVDRHIREYQTNDHDIMARALLDDRQIMERMRRILRDENLPEDLAYMALVESELVQSSESVNGAVGFWQFTEETAREYGMKVNDSGDDRLDLEKSTEAAGRYIRDLILDFGSGSSVMLAMAAYNSGPEKVRRAVRSVKDPIKQRNFWYLYQTKALPSETRDYVPKVFAAILIGRAPAEFGF